MYEERIAVLKDQIREYTTEIQNHHARINYLMLWRTLAQEELNKLEKQNEKD